MSGFVRVIVNTVADFGEKYGDTIYKCARIVDAGKTIHKISRNVVLSNGDKVTIVFNAAFSMVQMAEIGSSLSKSLPGKVRVGISVATGVLDVARIISHKFAIQGWDAGGVFEVVLLTLARAGVSKNDIKKIDC